ncbi:MAG: glycoside hydrolase family 97 catalytic domain-containing protein [Ignavibacteriae bacterium]|nr:glycoside hydrolase family 97 catalytic domain-containing protein [Ignavibacteriota bacterium]
MKVALRPLAFLLCSIVSAEPRENNVTSPNGVIEVVLNVGADGTPEFDLLYKGRSVMKKSRLGLVRDDADFSDHVRFISASDVEQVEDQYTLMHGKKIQCTYNANKKIFHFRNREDKGFDVVFQISNDGVAFRYLFPGEQSDGVKKIIDERTSFNLSQETRAWIQPIAKAKSGWNATNPSYEEHYYHEIDVASLPSHEPGWAFPTLFKSAGCWIALSETGLGRNYCGCRLTHDSGSTTFKIGFPQRAETMPDGGLNPESTLPWYSPWRVIAISDTLATLVESTLGTDLAEPSVLSDISFVKPGRSSWSWVLFKDDSTIFSVQNRFVDFASAMNWEYCLVDADWDRKIGDDKLGELCAYAASKNVGINVWYNSAGSWNTTPYTPRDKMLTKESRETEFKKLASHGVKGVKVDFFGGDGQSVMAYYQDIFEDAARHGLMVNCHGATIPRGWQRTYPNLVTMESIKGFEFVTFDQPDADKQPSHCAVIPFTRNLFDPMDFTPVCFSEVPNIQRRTTNSFELALSVLFLSGIQHFAEVPEGMSKVPTEARQILKEVPVAWDESKFVDGYPGKYVVIARRKGSVWHIAGINGEATERKLSLNLGFVGKPESSILITSGADSRSFEVRTNKIDPKQPLGIVLEANDGFMLKVASSP